MSIAAASDRGGGYRQLPALTYSPLFCAEFISQENWNVHECVWLIICGLVVTGVATKYKDSWGYTFKLCNIFSLWIWPRLARKCHHQWPPECTQGTRHVQEVSTTDFLGFWFLLPWQKKYVSEDFSTYLPCPSVLLYGLTWTIDHEMILPLYCNQHSYSKDYVIVTFK